MSERRLKRGERRAKCHNCGDTYVTGEDDPFLGPCDSCLEKFNTACRAVALVEGWCLDCFRTDENHPRWDCERPRHTLHDFECVQGRMVREEAQ